MCKVVCVCVVCGGGKHGLCVLLNDPGTLVLSSFSFSCVITHSYCTS